jgi:HEAT repeat protein
MSIDELIRKLSEDEGLSRERARDTLVLVGSAAIPALLPLLPQKSTKLRWEAAKTLSEIHDPATIPQLLAAVDDEDAGVRWLAAVALINTGFSSVAPVLEALATRPSSKALRQGAHHVFAELAGRNKVFGEIIKPVMDVLGETQPDSVLAPRAYEALGKIRAIQETAG